MDPQLVQRTRYLLKSRVKYTLSCPAQLFQSACRQLINWVEHHPVFSSIIKQAFCQGNWNFLADLNSTKNALNEPGINSIHCVEITTESHREHAALCYFIVSLIARFSFVPTETQHDYYDVTARSRAMWLICCLSEHLIGEDPRDNDKALEIVRDVAINGLYEYLDEQLDARNALLGLLYKYKHRSEWFRRKRLREIAENGLEHKKDGGERALAIDLYEYVYDQGVDYSIEPASASGEADLIAHDSDGHHVVIDAKYVAPSDPPSVVKKKLSHGFHQVAKYCDDHNEPVGYLVVYINHKASPRLPLDEADGFRFISVKGKNVYYVSVEIGDHPSASKAGIAEEVSITREELLKEVTLD